MELRWFEYIETLGESPEGNITEQRKKLQYRVFRYAELGKPYGYWTEWLDIPTESEESNKVFQVSSNPDIIQFVFDPHSAVDKRILNIGSYIVQGKDILKKFEVEYLRIGECESIDQFREFLESKGLIYPIIFDCTGD